MTNKAKVLVSRFTPEELAEMVVEADLKLHTLVCLVENAIEQPTQENIDAVKKGLEYEKRNG